MDRRQFLIQSCVVTAGAMLPLKKIFATKSGTFNTLRRNVGYFTERGGTIGWLACKDGLVVVDSQYPETAQHCLEGLQEKTSHPMDLLLNTHHHGDHTAGNPVFKLVAKKSVAHENVPVLMKKSFEQSDSDSEPAYPAETYTDSWKMDIGDETIHANYFGRAHTAGDSVIYFEKANVIHMGDLMFNRMNPYTDRPAGASVHNWIKVLSEVMEKYPDDTMFIFGHGKPEFGVTGKKEDLGVMKNYLSGMVEHVEKGVEAGKSKEEITDLKELPGFENFLYADFWSLSQNLNVVHQEVTGKKWLEI
jgi:glyoxylase-like metal-dependent hydrolase (beta-lactamase superfamily II)